MTADRWCLGWPGTRPPHIPDDGYLIDVGKGARLCRACWARWIVHDPEVAP